MPSNERTSDGRVIKTYAPGERVPKSRAAAKSAAQAESPRVNAATAALRAERTARSFGHWAAIGAEAGVRRAMDNDPDAERRDRAFVKAIRGFLLSSAERRDVTEASNGGYLAPQSFVEEFLLDVQYASALFAHSLTIRTDTGSALPHLPIAVADTGNSATTLAEDVTITETDPVLATVSFPQAPQWIANDLATLSRALVQDSGVNLSEMLLRVFGQRIARATDATWIPSLFAAAPAGNTVTTAVSATLDYQSVVDCVFALDAAYRMSPHCVWLASPATLKTLSTLVDTAGHPVLLPRKRDADPANQDDPGALVPNLLGFPVYESRNAPAIASGSVPLILADLSRAFVVRVVNDGLALQVLQERFVDIGALGYVGYARLDGQVAVSNAISAVKIK
jgi:HK97 family phage major capsid protein